jgi:acyl-CoA synthetase (AMP-forming)/AMP-acid ligase II
MGRIPKLPRPAQLELFREPPVTPAWEQLPRDARQRAQWLLARLLRSRRRARREDARGGEVRDE